MKASADRLVPDKMSGVACFCACVPFNALSTACHMHRINVLLNAVE